MVQGLALPEARGQRVGHLPALGVGHGRALAGRGQQFLIGLLRGLRHVELLAQHADALPCAAVADIRRTGQRPADDLLEVGADLIAVRTRTAAPVLERAVAERAEETARAFAAVDTAVRDASLRPLVAVKGVLLDFTDDGGTGHLQMAGDGIAAVAVAQAVLYFGAVCKSEV